MSVQDVYDIEGDIEAAVSGVLNDAEVTGLTPQDDPTLQKARPRAEVEAILGAGKDAHMHDLSAEADADMELVEDAWNITLQVAVITDAEIEVHTSYRSTVRHLMATLPKRINGITLLNHVAHGPVLHAGSSPMLKSDEGYYVTYSSFNFTISVQSDAWAKLNTTT